MEEDQKSLGSRASERLKTAAKQALGPDLVKSALATKLVALGLGLTFLSAGIDYFSHEDAIHKAVAGMAREGGATDFALWIDGLDKRFDEIKTSTLASLPAGVRDHLAGAALMAGLLALFSGLRMKLALAGEKRGKVIRDLGWAIAGPGILGTIAFTLLSWHGALVIRRASASFFSGIGDGRLKARDVWDLSLHYSQWAWTDVGGVLLIGGALVALGVGLWFAERRRPILPLAIARRTCLSGGSLALGYYAAATVIAIVSYGGALRVIAWPWKVDPGAYLVALGFMSVGLALVQTGRVELRNTSAGVEPQKAPPPA